MNETLEPDEKGEGVYTFANAAEFFPEEEREIARFHIDVYHRISKFISTNLYSFIASFINKLAEEKGNGVVRHCKLFHLYSFSSLSEKEWRKLPMDTPEGDFDRFAREKLIPLLEQKERKSEDL